MTKGWYRDEGLAALKQARALLDKAGVPFQHHIGVGEIAPTIASYAREKDCRQIAMGTHGRGGLAGALLGSVATKVIHLADRPVLLVKQRFCLRRRVATLSFFSGSPGIDRRQRPSARATTAGNACCTSMARLDPWRT